LKIAFGVLGFSSIRVVEIHILISFLLITPKDTRLKVLLGQGENLHTTATVKFRQATTTDVTYSTFSVVICHGDFLNADHEYVHKNKSVKGFGSYGDIMIRDRKMYVAPTPFAVAQGLTGTRTLLIPSSWKPPKGFKKVGDIVRIEAANLVVGYAFDLKTNNISVRTVPNPEVGREHCFSAYRIESDSDKTVTLVSDPHQEDIEDEDE
jgi:hypothetical protein